MCSMMYRHEVTSPLSERNGQRDSTRERNWADLSQFSENDLFLTMQRKMAGLDNQQKMVIKEYEQELDAMKNEIKKIRGDYDTLKQKNVRYRNQLKDKNDQLKKLQEEQTRMAKRQQSEGVWSTEKTKLLARVKQLEIEKKQTDEKYNSFLAVKDENADLKREVESLRFRETLWMEEKERAETERKKSREVKDIMKYVDLQQPRSLDWSTSNRKSNFDFDQAWAHISQQSPASYSSLPTLHISSYRESDDLQDIRKSLNEAREELMLAKGDSKSKRDQFLKELKEREELQKTVNGLRDQRENDTVEVRHMITTLESKITTLESNCLTEVQNLVHNVDILKQELLNSQKELKSLKAYSKKIDKKREEEKIQMLNESRELKLDLSSLRSEMRDKSQGSDRTTDQSRSALTDSRDPASEENFESHYSPLVGFVGSRCDYLKMKLDTLKKHLNNLDVQTKTVLNQSLVEASSSSDTITNPGEASQTNAEVQPRKDNTSQANKQKNQNSLGANNEDDDGDIVVVTPRPHRNRYDEELDILIVENGQNIERLRLPSLEEEESEDDEANENSDRDVAIIHDMVFPSPRKRDRVLTSVDEGDEGDEAIQTFLTEEKSRTSNLVSQVDSRFEQLERELEMQSRRRQIKSQGQGRGPMPAYHHFNAPKSAH